jgi:beta-glucosidase
MDPNETEQEMRGDSIYNHKPAARRGYLFDDVTPLYAFGFGLSYTRFRFGKPRLKKSVIGKHESTAVRVDVTNTGARTGDEVVQMYIRDEVSSVTRHVRTWSATPRGMGIYRQSHCA